jgi:WD40 repeat protein
MIFSRESFITQDSMSSFSLVLILIFSLVNCKPKTPDMSSDSFSSEQQELIEIQLTSDPSGHFLNQRQAFSPDDLSLVFDGRNDETKIGENAYVKMIDVNTKAIRIIYELDNQTAFGPGVGAVSFHPLKNQVVFIHGLKNAWEAQPYGFTRRFAMQVDLDVAKNTRPLEARDVQAPFTAGALRGGSHAYSYSSDGQWLSFTYNDAILEQESMNNPEVVDLRTVGVFLVGEKVSINGKADESNFDGTSFAILLAEVKANPQPGSDEISKAYEEGWVGNTGYKSSDGKVQKHALAFLGDVITSTGEKVTEVFISDIPDDLPGLIRSVNAGSRTTLPSIPKGVKQRRLTFTSTNKNPGVQGPRQWLRSSPDGSEIYFYQTDDAGIVQIYSVSPNGGVIKAITANDFSAETAFSLSHDGKYLAYGAKEAIYVTSVADGKTQVVLYAPTYSSNALSNINWSNSGYIIAYNRKTFYNGEAYFQIYTLNLNTFLTP